MLTSNLNVVVGREVRGGFAGTKFEMQEMLTDLINSYLDLQR
jgi:hypothetical protein